MSTSWRQVICTVLDAFPPWQHHESVGKLLVIPFGQICRNRRQIAKQSSGPMVRSSCEVHLCGRRGCGIAVGRADIPWAERPNAIDGQRLPGAILQKSVKFSRSQVVGCNEATGLGVTASRELPDEEVVAESSEIERSQSHAPRSIQPITVLQMQQ